MRQTKNLSFFFMSLQCLLHVEANSMKSHEIFREKDKASFLLVNFLI